MNTPNDRIAKFLEHITGHEPKSPWLGCRTFLDGQWAYIEPRLQHDDGVSLHELTFLKNYSEVSNIEVVYRNTPNAGIYVRFKMTVTT